MCKYLTAYRLCMTYHILQIIQRVENFYENREGWEGLTGYLPSRRRPAGHGSNM
jgi:hypothetical protein